MTTDTDVNSPNTVPAPEPRPETKPDQLTGSTSTKPPATLLATARDNARRWLQPLWRDWRIGPAVAVGASGLWGLLAGIWTPRGPLSSGEAIWSIVLSLAFGAIAGLAMRSRLAIAVAPVAFAVVFELTRLGTDGPTVDGIHFSTYGTIAFVTGRGFHALLSLLPMVLGAAVGAGATRVIDPNAAGTSRRVGRIGRRSIAVVTAVGLAALTVGLARPARTVPIVDGDGNEVPGSIAELTSVQINGHDLGLMIRGHSVDNPVLLFLAGGPGGSEFGAMRRHLPELEEHFTVVTWDPARIRNLLRRARPGEHDHPRRIRRRHHCGRERSAGPVR